MRPPPIPRANVFIPLSPHASFRRLGFFLNLPLASKILPESRITTKDLCKSCLKHFNIDVPSTKGHNAKNSAEPETVDNGISVTSINT